MQTRSQTKMGATMGTAAELATARSRKPPEGRSAKADRPKSEATVKKTIVMPRKLHCLLSSVATFQDMDASELAAKLIDRGLKESYGKYYAALDTLKPKVARSANTDASGDSTDRQGGVVGVNDDEAEAA